LLSLRQSASIGYWFDEFSESRYDAERLSLLDFPLLQMMVDLIHERISGKDPLEVKGIVRF
jgi:hypothetical protein